MWSLPILALASLLPERWRARAHLESAALKGPALLGGVLEVFAGIAWGVHAFAAYRARYYAAVGEATTAGLMVFGATLFIGFLFFSWQGLLALFLATEGLVRALAAAIGEPCGSAVLFAIDRALIGVERWRTERARAPLAVDRVVELEDGVEIWSCRERAWDELTTLRLGERDLRVIEVGRRADPERPHVYRLAPVPPGWIVRKLVAYTPEDVLAWTPPQHPRIAGSKTRYSGGR